MTSVFFNDALHGWAVGYNNQIYTTTDSGNSWVKRAMKNSAVHFRSVFSTSPEEAWAAGSYQYGQCWHTMDGGANWTEAEPATLAHLYAVYFVNNCEGWAAGDRGTIIHTIDGGTTWTQEITRTRADLRTLAVPDSSTIFAGGYDGCILERKMP